MEAKERHTDDIRKDVELAGIEADKILADQVDLDIKIRVGGVGCGVWAARAWCVVGLWSGVWVVSGRHVVWLSGQGDGAMRRGWWARWSWTL